MIQKNELPNIYPDYVGVTIPVGIAPLNFSMVDDEVETVDVVVKGSKEGSIHANGSYADFDVDEWHQLLEKNKGGTLTLTVCAEKNTPDFTSRPVETDVRLMSRNILSDQRTSTTVRNISY